MIVSLPSSEYASRRKQEILVNQYYVWLYTKTCLDIQYIPSDPSRAYDCIEIRFFVVFLEEIRVDEDGSSGQHSLLISSSICWEGDLKRIGISEHLGHERLGLFQDVALEFFATLVSNAGVVDSERSSATTPSAGISFRAAVDAHATAAGGRMDQVGVSAVVVVDLEGRNAV